MQAQIEGRHEADFADGTGIKQFLDFEEAGQSTPVIGYEKGT